MSERVSTQSLRDLRDALDAAEHDLANGEPGALFTVNYNRRELESMAYALASDLLDAREEIARQRVALDRARIECAVADEAIDALRAVSNGDGPLTPPSADRAALLREGSAADLREELSAAWGATDVRCRWLARLRRDLLDARRGNADAVRAETSACAAKCRAVAESWEREPGRAAEATGARTCAVVLEGRWMTAVEASVGAAAKGSP